MRRTCESCGNSYEAKRSTSRFCKPACRVRASRGVVVAIGTGEQPSPVLTGVAGATQKELVDAQRLDTAYGQAAMVLAKRIDAGRDTGSAMATMTKQLRETLAEAVKGARKEGSKVDELSQRRLDRQHRNAR